MKKIAIIGIGTWGKNLVREFSQFVIITKCVTLGNPKNLEWLQKNYPKILPSTNINEILNDNSIDAVVIATPISSHYKIIKRVLESGKHVFVEKPMTQTILQANNLLNIAKRKKLCLFVGYIFLHNQIFKKIKKINEKEFITTMNFDWKKFGTFNEDIFENLLSHELSINLELFGPPKKIKLLNKSSFITNMDSFSLELNYNNNKSIINVDRIANYKKKTSTIITKKNFYIWDNDILYKFNKRSKSLIVFFQSKHSPLYLECKKFISDINNKKFNIDSAILAKNIISIISKMNKTKPITH